jgi:hypothetical protein
VTQMKTSCNNSARYTETFYTPKNFNITNQALV